MRLRWPWSRPRASAPAAPGLPTVDWWRMVGETIVALYAEERHRAPDEAERAVLLAAALAGEDADQLRTRVQATRPPSVIVTALDPDPSPEPPPARPALRGRLRQDGDRAFVDDDGDVLPVILHAGDLLAQWAHGEQERVRAILQQAKTAGYTGVRTWSVLAGPYWRGLEVGPWTPNYAGLLHEFAAALRAHGLVWAVSQGDLWRAGLSEGSRTETLEALIAMGQAYPDVAALFDAGNEAWSRGDGDPTPNERVLAQWLARLAARVPGRMYTVTAPPDGEIREEQLQYHLPPSTLISVHGYRGGHWYDKVRHIFSTSYDGEAGPPATRLIFQSEPFGPGELVSASRNKHELSAAVMQLSAVMATMSRQMWTYFCSPGVKLTTGERFTDMPGFRETPAAVALLPKDIMRWPRLTHGGRRDGWFEVTESTDEVRVDQVLSADGRAVALAYGPRIAAHRQTRGTVHARHEFRDETGLKGVLYLGEM
jgi:hypothetical protein